MTSNADIFKQAETHVRAGRLDDAIRAYRSILDKDPADTRAKYRIAVVHLMREAFAEGEALLRECRAEQPENTDILFSLGRACMAQGNYEPAIEVLSVAARLDTGQANLHAALGDAFFLSGQTTEALGAYQAAHNLAPGDIRIHVNMANALSRLGDHDQAAAVADVAYKAAPDRPEIALAYANTLRVGGRLDEALAIVDGLLAASPGAVPLLACKAEILDRRGDSEQAARLLAPLVHTQAVPVALARACGQVAVNADQDLLAAEPVVAMIERCLAQPRLNRFDRRGLLFMQANLQQKLGDPDTAFETCLRANAEAGMTYDTEAVDTRFGAYREVYASDRLPALARASIRSPRPLFIVGMPRSGTTLVEQILDSHPDAAGAGELDDIPQAAHAMPGYPLAAAALSSDTLDATAQAFLQTLDTVSPDTRYVVDKMPINFEHLGYIWQLFPDARIIHCQRHPLGVGLSCLFQNFRNHNEFAFSMPAFAHFYRHYTGLMEHWAATLDLPIFELRYEDLVADPEGRIAALLEFCDLPWDDACLAFDRNQRFINTLSYAQVRKPISGGAGERHRRYAGQLAPLAADLSDEITRYESGAS